MSTTVMNPLPAARTGALSRKGRRPRPALNHGGQALSEFLLALLVLLPLLLIVPLLGKYLDLAQRTTLASRFAGFGLSIRHPGSRWGEASAATLATELRGEIYQLGSSPSGHSGSRNPLWQNHRGEALIDGSDEHFRLSISTSLPSTLQRARFADDFGLGADRLHQVELSLSPLPVKGLPPFDEFATSIDRHFALLVDSWAAAGSEDVAARLRRHPDRLRGPFPYRNLQRLLDPLRPHVSILEGQQLPAAGRVDADLVPGDRIR